MLKSKFRMTAIRGFSDYVIVDNSVLELDRDELDGAFQCGAINEIQYERTLSEGKKIEEYLNTHTVELVQFFADRQKELKSRLSK